jgi:hypothetical protein
MATTTMVAAAAHHLPAPAIGDPCSTPRPSPRLRTATSCLAAADH